MKLKERIMLLVLVPLIVLGGSNLFFRIAQNRCCYDGGY